MATDARATTFVTGAAGFIGSELVKVLVARGHRVFGLTDSLEAAERVRRMGGVPVMGHLLEPGPWQDQAAAEWVSQRGERRGAIGPACAFFYAGARALLVPHWEVSSAAAVKLTTAASTELKQTPALGRAEAFHRSMRALVASGSLAEAHPAMWGPFAVVG